MRYGHRTVAVLGARHRVDLTVPADVPVAELLPELLDLAREPAADAGWDLCRLGGRPLDGEETLAALGVRDGELLQLVARAEAFDPPVVGAVEDALAHRAGSAPRWSPADGALLLGAVAAAAVAGSAAVAGWAVPGDRAVPAGWARTSGPGAGGAVVGWVGRGVPAAVGAVLWLVVAAALARSGRGRLGLLLGVAALPLGAAAGAAGALAAVGGTSLWPAAGAGAGAAAAALGLSVAVPARYGRAATVAALGVAVTALPLAVVGAVTAVLGAPVRGGAGALALTWLVVLAVAPRLAVAAGRLAAPPARLAAPLVTAGTHRRPGPGRREPSVPGAASPAGSAYPGQVGSAAGLSVGALVAVLAGAGLGLAGCWLGLAGGGPADRAVLAVSVLVALTRARGYRFREHLLPALLTGAAGLAVLAGTAVAALPSPVARLAAVWAGGLVLVLAAARLRPLVAPPLLRRTVEWAETAALAALVLLVLGRYGAFGAVAELARRLGS